VQEAITQGRPLIAAFGESVVTEPVGGHGLTLPEIDISERPTA
jgi:hypothetical protein